MGPFFPKHLLDMCVEPTTALCLSDEGCALDLLDICGIAGRRLALVVKRDIWCGALKALERLKLRHCDIYAINIVVAGTGETRKAKLIDWESATSIGSSVEHSPTHTPEVDHSKVDELDAKCTASMIWFLWDKSAALFDRKLHVQHVKNGLVMGMGGNKQKFKKFVNSDVTDDQLEV